MLKKIVTASLAAAAMTASAYAADLPARMAPPSGMKTACEWLTHGNSRRMPARLAASA